MKLFKPKYKFNPQTLQYDKIEFSLKRIFLKSLPHIAMASIFGAVFMFAYLLIFDSPKERFLKSENEFLKKNFKQMQARLNTSEEVLEKLALRDNYFYRITYNQDTIPLAIRESGVGGVDRYRHFDGYESTDIVKEVALKLDKVEKKLDIQTLSFNELFDVVNEHKKALASIPFIQPIHPNDLTRIGSFYGFRVHPVMRIRHMHDGIDLTAPTGTPIYAAGDGKVVTVNKNKGRRGYGNLVIIDHEVNGLSTRYAHLYEFNVKQGDYVKRGQKIGTVGNTGMSTAPHLHYEIRVNGKSVNPLRYMLTPDLDEYDELITLALYPGISFD